MTGLVVTRMAPRRTASLNPCGESLPNLVGQHPGVSQRGDTAHVATLKPVRLARYQFGSGSAPVTAEHQRSRAPALRRRIMPAAQQSRRMPAATSAAGRSACRWSARQAAPRSARASTPLPPAIPRPVGSATARISRGFHQDGPANSNSSRSSSHCSRIPRCSGASRCRTAIVSPGRPRCLVSRRTSRERMPGRFFGASARASRRATPAVHAESMANAAYQALGIEIVRQDETTNRETGDVTTRVSHAPIAPP